MIVLLLGVWAALAVGVLLGWVLRVAVAEQS